MQERNTTFHRFRAKRILPVGAEMSCRENVNHPIAKYLGKSVPRNIRSARVWFRMKVHVRLIMRMETINKSTYSE